MRHDQTLTVYSKQAEFDTVEIINDVGGTSWLPDGAYRVRVLSSLYDYETGIRFIGELLDERDIAVARRVGTTGFLPEDYRKYGNKHYKRTRRARRRFNPKRVHFSEFQIAA